MTRRPASSDSGTSGATSASRPRPPRRGRIGSSPSSRWRGARIRSGAASFTARRRASARSSGQGATRRSSLSWRRDPLPWWTYRQWGVRALAALGRPDEAIAYAEASRGINDSPVAIAAACEEVLLSSGRVEEAYRRHALEATRSTSYLATYRALARKYPQKRPEELLGDLVATAPGDEGKWFATAKEVGLLDEAIRLANQAACDPKTLTRAGLRRRAS
jgi:tetratricopeptide (TPR) repeat protein